MKVQKGPVAIVTEVEGKDAASDIEAPLIEPIMEEPFMIDDYAIAQAWICYPCRAGRRCRCYLPAV